jgi:hypothetical protein
MMATTIQPPVLTSEAIAILIEEIEHLHSEREVSHCSQSFQVSPFAIYATCPSCQAKIKLRSFAAVPEIEDVFDAVFRWMNQPGASDHAQQRIQEIAEDTE